MKTGLRITLILLCLGTFVTFAQTDWELSKDKLGIKIYLRDVAASGHKEYKAVCTVESTVETVLKALLNAPPYFDNAPDNQSYLLKNIGTNQHVFYARKNLPWPIRDRDVITMLTQSEQENGVIKIDLSAYPNGLPEKENTIRIKELKGHWLIEELDDSRVRVTQQLYLNPGGSLPSTITNSLIVKGPLKKFQAIKEATEI